MISGKFQDRSTGFYSGVLAGEIPWESTCHTTEQESPSEIQEPSPAELVSVSGSPVSLSYREIWSDLLDACDDEEENAFLQALLEADLEGCEKPMENAEVICGGKRYYCPLVWKDARIIFCDMDDALFDALEHCGWQIYYGNESTSEIEMLIQQLKKQ